jgi:PAS domain S-box-containing protein
VAEPELKHVQARPGAEGLLRALARAAKRALATADPEQAIREMLPELGAAAGATRASVRRSGVSDAVVAAWASEPIAADDASHQLALPIEDPEATWGELILVRSSRTAPWTADEREILQDAAALIGAAVRRAELDHADRETQIPYRALVEQIPAITYIDVSDGTEKGAWPSVFVSPQIQEILGYTAEEWKADASLWASIVHPIDRAAAEAADARHYATGEPLHSEYRMLSRNGRIVWIEDTATIWESSDGRRYSQGVLTDITLRKEHEQQLEAAEARFRALVERTPAVTYQEATSESYDPDVSMMYVSPQIEEILGYPAESWWTIPGFWTGIIHPDDHARVSEESDRTTESGTAYSQEYRMIASDGRVVWFHDDAVPIPRTDEDQPQLWQGVMVDITAQKEAEERLRAAQERYRALVENIPAVTYTESIDGSAEDFYISPQAKTLFGYDPEEWRWTNHFWRDHIHPADRERVLAEDRRTNETGDRYEIEYRVIAKDGRAVWIHDEATLIEDEHGGGRYWRGFMLDITERMMADENLRAAEAKYRTLVEQNPAVIYTQVIDPAGHSNTAYISPRSEAVTGYTLEEIRDEPDLWRRMIHPDDRERVLAEDIEGNQTGQAFDMQYRMIAKDGKVVWVHDQATLVHDALGRPAFWQGFLLDITEQMEAEERAREGEIKYRSLVENIPAVTYIEEVEANPVDFFMSPQVESILGYKPEEWTATEDFWIRHIHPDDYSTVMAEDVRTDETNDPFEIEYRFRHKDGRWVWLRESAVVVRDETGEPHYWQGFMLDITQRKEAERAIERALEIERDATARLRSLDEMKNTFLQAVSHDLRTPLAAILGLAVTLERSDLDLEKEEAHDLARRIAGNARKLDRLVTDLLDLDRLARGIVEPKLHPTDVGALVRRVLTESDVSEGRTISVETSPVVIPVDAAKVERIVENLLSNTVRHTPADTQVWVRVEARPEGALLIVEDEGPGVHPEFREAVFQPFLQGPNAPSHSPGVGVGLALVARFAELHGGRAWVEDRPGGGASFRVVFPARAERPAGADAPPAEVAERAAG